MQKRDRRVGDLFLSDDKERQRAYERLAKHKSVEKLRENVEARSGSVAFEAAKGMERFMKELLDIDLVEIFMQGWKKYDAVVEVLARSKKNPLKKYFVALSKHTLRSRHRPGLQVEIEGIPVQRIDFDVDLKLELEGFVLEIKNGEIVALDSGDCRADGKVNCEGVTLYERHSQKLYLPVRFDLEGENDE